MEWFTQNWVWVAVGVGVAFYFFRSGLGGHAAGHGGGGGYGEQRAAGQDGKQCDSGQKSSHQH